MQIEAIGLTKRYKSRSVVDGLNFTLEPGKITGFLGPNGSGKSTTMALMFGLVIGKGLTHFDGRIFRSLKNGPSRIGVYLGPKTFHPNVNAQQHLRISALTRGIPLSRVSEVLELVGLSSASKTNTKAMSTGMLQKLGLATALLSSPEVLILDEPANGLDPQSVQWLRNVLKEFSISGGTVLLSSHLINEVELFADNLLVIARGKLIASETLDTFLRRQKPTGFKVRTDESEKFISALNASGLPNQRLSLDVVEVQSEKTLNFIKVAAKNNIEILEVVPIGSSLEDIFLSLTAGQDDYSTTAGKLDDSKAMGSDID